MSVTESMPSQIPEIRSPEIMNHSTFESRQDMHLIGCSFSPFFMVAVPCEKFGTCNMQPLTKTGDPHAGLVNMEHLCFRQEFSYPLFNSCKITVALLNCINQCPGAQRTSENIGECLPNPIIRNQLVNAKIHHQCLEVLAILDGELYS